MLATLGSDASQIGADKWLAWWESWRHRWHGDKRKGADTLFALVAWEIWKERNARCFRGSPATVGQLLSTIKISGDLSSGVVSMSCCGEGIILVPPVKPPPPAPWRFCKKTCFYLIHRCANLLCIREKYMFGYLPKKKPREPI
jgi:hypothetical protein